MYQNVFLGYFTFFPATYDLKCYIALNSKVNKYIFPIVETFPINFPLCWNLLHFRAPWHLWPKSLTHITAPMEAGWRIWQHPPGKITIARKKLVRIYHWWHTRLKTWTIYCVIKQLHWFFYCMVADSITIVSNPRCNRIIQRILFSLWGGSWAVCTGHDSPLTLLHHHHTSSLNAICGQGCPGVWKGSHLQTWKTLNWRSQGSRGLFCHSLCGYLWKDWHEVSNIWDTTSGGKKLLLYTGCPKKKRSIAFRGQYLGFRSIYWDM